MLVLSRKAGQSICIGGRTIVVSVVDVRGDKVRLGIEAPPDVSVHRNEVQDVVDREQGCGVGCASHLSTKTCTEFFETGELTCVGHLTAAVRGLPNRK
jgi:carbon storage regulator